MEITRQDFVQHFPQLKRDIMSADFISIDAEFTGLTSPDTQMRTIDTIEERYNKIKHSVEQFSVVQYGVCTFKRQADGTFLAKPYNFYIFGGDNETIMTKRSFSCLTSSIKFLRDNKFDFNKWIDCGIPFYNFSEEDTRQTTFRGTSMHVRESQLSESSLDGAANEYLASVKKRLSQWWKGDTRNPLYLTFDKLFHKRLLYQAIGDSAYNGYLQAKEAGDSNNTVIVTCMSDQERSQKYSQEPIVNFRTIIEAIKMTKCPVVFHNGAYDLCHTVDQFWRYLPSEYKEFKSLINSMWEQVVDTKYLAEYHPKLKGRFPSSALEPLYKQANAELKESSCRISFGEGFDRYAENDDKAHEAAYDAYMTGVVYLDLLMRIQKSEGQEKKAAALKDMTNDELETVSSSSSGSNSSELPSARTGQKRKQTNIEDEENKRRKTKVDAVSNEKESSSSSEEGTASSAANNEGDLTTSSDEADVSNKPTFVLLSDSITPYYDRIYLMHSNIPYLNLKSKKTQETLNKKCSLPSKPVLSYSRTAQQANIYTPASFPPPSKPVLSYSRTAQQANVYTPASSPPSSTPRLSYSRTVYQANTYPPSQHTNIYPPSRQANVYPPPPHPPRTWHTGMHYYR